MAKEEVQHAILRPDTRYEFHADGRKITVKNLSESNLARFTIHTHPQTEPIDRTVGPLTVNLIEERRTITVTNKTPSENPADIDVTVEPVS